MTTTQITLDKKAYPLMMHLSILPKCAIDEEKPFSYNPLTQTCNIKSVVAGHSQCNKNGSIRNDD